MKGALVEFSAEIEKLRSFVAASRAEEELYSVMGDNDAAFRAEFGHLIDSLMADVTSKRRYGYLLSIIVMYGALERFVDNAARAYVSNIARLCSKYDDIPEKLRNMHLELSIEYLWRLKENKIKDEDDTQQVVNRLAKCVEGATDFELNSRAFTQKAGNMNFDRIRKIFLNAGIELHPKRLALLPTFQERYEQLYGEVLDPSSDVSLKTVFARVDDLVETRNKIAHGAIDIYEIEDSNLIEERITGIENVVFALLDILEQEFLMFCLSSKRLVQLGPVIDVFNNEIVCIAHNNGQISIGNVIAMPTGIPMEPIRYGRVSSIEVDGVRQETVEAADGLKIGMKVGFRAQKASEYHAVPREIARVLRS